MTDVDSGVSSNLIDPVAEYDRDEGLAIIGGFVYRGSQIPALEGRYVFGDFGRFDGTGSRLFYLNADNVIQEFAMADDVGPQTLELVQLFAVKPSIVIRYQKMARLHVFFYR